MEVYQQKVAPVMDKVCEMLHFQSLDSNEHLQKVTSKVPGVKPSHVALTACALLIILSLLNVGSSLICNFVGFIYPAYMSFKALETKEPNDDKQWLTYWVVFSLFTVMDGFFGYVLSFLPFYYFLKLTFFVYLFHFKTYGALAIYEKLVQPFFKKQEVEIDEKLNQLTSDSVSS